ncbi:MAG: response regulator transcription factor [Chloroflexota bacterium]|nr:response regulator transcription factor [Chloroflexota bacterium]
MPQESIRVLIADDHPLFRSGMRALLAADPDTKLAGEATTGEEVTALAAELQPDIVLMDLHMPGLSGIDATRRVLQTSPNTRILVVTMFEDDHSVFSAIRAGARGYVLKGANPEEVLRAIRVVAGGEAIFSPSVATRLIDFFSGLRPEALPQSFPDLTDREREILDLIAQGRSNAEIARELSLSAKTVANHVSNILSKLQVADRAQAMLRAREAGLGQGRP